MKGTPILAAVFGAIALLFCAQLSEAEATPAEIVRKTVTQVQELVKGEKGSLSDEQLDEKLRAVIYPVFDFQEMSRRCLGRNWSDATAEQQKEFIDLFSDMLARNYLRRIREYADRSDFEVSSASKLAENRSLVQTKVAYDGQNASIDYRLRLKDGSWQVYDVIIENIGLVSNYRNEFSGIIRREKMEGLLERLRRKS